MTYKKGHQGYWSGKKLKEIHPISQKTRKKMRSTHLGFKNSFFGKKHSEETKNEMSDKAILRGKSSIEKGWDRIYEEIPKLEKQGFKCIPITEVIPDIVAIKDGKIYAIEVEYNEPNYDKYSKISYKYDEIIWLIRKKSVL